MIWIHLIRTIKEKKPFIKVFCIVAAIKSITTCTEKDVQRMSKSREITQINILNITYWCI